MVDTRRTAREDNETPSQQGSGSETSRRPTAGPRDISENANAGPAESVERPDDLAAIEEENSRLRT